MSREVLSLHVKYLSRAETLIREYGTLLGIGDILNLIELAKELDDKITAIHELVNIDTILKINDVLKKFHKQVRTAVVSIDNPPALKLLEELEDIYSKIEKEDYELWLVKERTHKLRGMLRGETKITIGELTISPGDDVKHINIIYDQKTGIYQVQISRSMQTNMKIAISKTQETLNKTLMKLKGPKSIKELLIDFFELSETDAQKIMNTLNQIINKLKEQPEGTK